MKHSIETTYTEEEVGAILIASHAISFGAPPAGYEWALKHRYSYDTKWTVVAVEATPAPEITFKEISE